MRRIVLYADGACKGNPGPGGYGAIIEYKAIGKKKTLSAGYRRTTNSRMELLAVIEGLAWLNNKFEDACEVKIYSDSKYVVDPINQGWLKKWQRDGWRRSGKKKVLNIDLWKKLIELMKIHEVKFSWVKGHSGNKYNERCDLMASTAAEGNDELLIDTGYERIK